MLKFKLYFVFCDKKKGIIARGKYSMKTQITDDDKRLYLAWEWTLEIAKDWK
jgi:hypothetical protein